MRKMNSYLFRLHPIGISHLQQSWQDQDQGFSFKAVLYANIIPDVRLKTRKMMFLSSARTVFVPTVHREYEYKMKGNVIFCM